jgi:ribosomal protein S18 acetylase RimI-like enzyme
MKKNKNFFKYDGWLSAVLKKKVFFILNPRIKNIKYPKKIDFAYVKINNKKNKIINFFKKNKFILINSNITFSKSIKTANKNNNDKIIFMNAKKKDQKILEYISSNNLIESRFSIDKNFQKREAALIKKKWIQNFFLGKRGDALHVIKIKEKIIGFVLLIYKKKLLIIDLIAIKKKFQSKGYGTNLIKYINSYYINDFNKIIVGTQSNNFLSNNFYKKLGFKKIKEELVLHKHFN